MCVWKTMLVFKPASLELESLAIEIIGTWLFVFVILITRDSNSGLSSDGILKSISISLTLIVCVFISASISGACINPAVGVAVNIWWFAINEGED